MSARGKETEGDGRSLVPAQNSRVPFDSFPKACHAGYQKGRSSSGTWSYSHLSFPISSRKWFSVMKAFLCITNSRNRLSNHCTSRQSRREYGEKHSSRQRLSVYRPRCHCCEIYILSSITLISDIVYIQWILKELALLI